jgi:hypothetical protein
LRARIRAETGYGDRVAPNRMQLERDSPSLGDVGDNEASHAGKQREGLGDGSGGRDLEIATKAQERSGGCWFLAAV